MSDQEKRIQEAITLFQAGRKYSKHGTIKINLNEDGYDVVLSALNEKLQRERQDPVQPTREKNIEICTISGCEGECVALNQYRIAGPKPYGGGRVVKRWNTSLHDISNALRGIATLTPIATEPKGEATT